MGKTIFIPDSLIPFSTRISMNLVDCFFKGKASNGVYRNILAQPYYGKLVDLGLNATLYPSGGHICNYTGVNMVDDGNAYNFQPEYFDGTSDDYDTYDDGVALIDWGHDFGIDSINLNSALGNVNGDVAFNIKNLDNDDLDWFVDNFEPEFILFGDELQDDWDGNAYKTAANGFFTHLDGTAPLIQRIVDTGLVYKNNGTTDTWNGIVKTISGAQHGKYYIQLGDRCAFTSDQDANIVLLNNYFSTLFPADLVKFQGLFGLWKMAIVEIQLEDNRDDVVQYINNTPVGCWALGKIYETIFNNTQDISYAAWMSLKNIIDSSDTTDNNYAVLKQIGIMSGAQYVSHVTFNGMDGTSGVALFRDDDYFLLVNNQSGNDYILDEITLTNKSVVGTIDRTTQYANTWNDDEQSEQATEFSPVIRRYSTSVLSFQVQSTTTPHIFYPQRKKAFKCCP